MSTESLSYKHLFKKRYFLMILSVDQEALDLYPKYDSVHHGACSVCRGQKKASIPWNWRYKL